MSEKGSRESGRRRSVSRRRFVQATGAAGVAASLAGCTGFGGGGGGGGNGGDAETIDTSVPEGDITVQFAADGNFQGASDAINEALQANGLPENITLEFLGDSFNTDDRRAKYNQTLNAGQEEPTLLMMDNGWMIPFIARGQIQNLTQSLPQEITDTVQNDYFQASAATATGPDGDLYGVPLFADFPTMQYNKKYLREVGYDESDFEEWATNPMTWAEFSQITKEALDAAPDGTIGYSFQANAYEGLSCCDFNEFMSSWGGAYFGGRDNLFGPIGDRPITVEEEPVVNSIKMVRKFIHGDDAGDSDGFLDDYAGNIAPAAVTQWTEEPSREPFTNGNVIMHRNWPYSLNLSGTEDTLGEDLGAMPLPYTAEEGANYEGVGGSTSALGGWHIAINPNASAEKKSAAYHIIQTLLKRQMKLDLFEIGGWIPPQAEVLASDDASELDVIGRYTDTLAIAGENAMPRPVTVVWPQESTQISKEVNASLRLEKDPSDAMSDLAASLEQIEESGSGN